MVGTVLELVSRRRQRPRIVRRVRLHCPHRRDLVEVDILQGPDAGRRPVLRCSARPERPPACDHACRSVPEAFHAARALLIFPAGTTGVPNDVG